MLLGGERDTACTIVGGTMRSTLSDDAFPMHRFDFMLSNPPHGRSWKAKLERMGGRERMRDRRFAIEHAGDPGFPWSPDDRQPDAVGPGTI